MEPPNTSYLELGAPMLELNQAMPPSISDTEALDRLLSKPTPAVVESLKHLQGDIIILGVGGKMGPTLAWMAKQASELSHTSRRVIGVSRFSDPNLIAWFESKGIETIACDLLDEHSVMQLPDCPNVIYMAGMKFGATGNESLTWAMNTYLPAVVCKKYKKSRIAAFSTGNVYGMMPINAGGARETDIPNPVGEYAMSCLGRERMFEHFSKTYEIPISIIRLYYATELRYGVLVDIAQHVYQEKPVDVSMTALNSIWQGDANAMSLLSLHYTASPPFVINLVGSELLNIRTLAARFGEIMGKKVTYTGEEQQHALLGSSLLSNRMFGYPQVSVDQMILWIADWVSREKENLGKPTHFEVTDGKY